MQLSFRLIRNVGLAIIIAISIGICIIAFVSLNKTTETLLSIVESDFPVLFQLDTINTQFNNLSENFTNFTTTEHIGSEVITDPLNRLITVGLQYPNVAEEIRKLKFTLTNYITQEENDPASSDSISSKTSSQNILDNLVEILSSDNLSISSGVRIQLTDLVRKLNQALNIYSNRSRITAEDVLLPLTTMKNTLREIPVKMTVSDEIQKALEIIYDITDNFSIYADKLEKSVNNLEILNYKTNAVKFIRQLNGILVSINYSIKNHISNSQSQIVNDVNVNKRIFLGAAFISLFAGLAVAVFISMSLSRIVKKPVVFLNDFWEGKRDLTQELTGTTNDEIGELYKTVITFFNNFRTIVLQMKKILDFHRETSKSFLDVSHITSEKSEHIQEIIDANRNMVQNLTTQINRALEVVNNINDFASNISNSVQEQSSAIEESSSSIHSITASIEKVSQVVETEKKLTTDLSKTAVQSMEKMQVAVDTIQSISQSTSNMLEMIEVIDSISKQTDLLAMNAAIEAAHAGDAGKGFAVVAEEIQKLSEEVKTNVVDISHILTNTIDEIQQASQINTEAGDAFEKIVFGIQNVADAMEGIGGSMSELNVGSSEIRTAMDSVVLITHGINDGTSEIKNNLKSIQENFFHISDISKKTVQNTDDTLGAVSMITESIEKMNTIGIKNEEYVAALEEELDQFVTEKRQYDRFEFTHKLLISPALFENESQYKQEAISLDIGVGGLLLYTKAKFSENSECIVEITDEVKSKGKILRENIPDIRRRFHLDDDYSIYAIRFFIPLEESVLKKILGDHVQKIDLINE